MYELIPDELKNINNWVCWKLRPDEKSHSGISKIPINPITGGQAQSNNPSTWSDFDTAVRVSADYAGIGFMFSGSGYFGIDIDDCSDMLNAYLNGNAGQDNIISEFINTLQSYSEFSYSGSGIHIICKGKLPDGARRRENVEMYDTGRFFVMTGDCCSKYVDIAECTEKIKPLHAKYLGAKNTVSKPQRNYNAAVTADISEIIKTASESKNGGKFRKLFSGDYSDYPSQSEADMALCNLLAFWCKGDASKADAIFRRSGLMRDKWDRKQSGSTYGALTIQNAIANCNNTYDGSYSDNYKISVGGKSELQKHEKYKVKKGYTFDDTGNAKRLIDRFGDILKYSYVEKKWLYYQYGKWIYDNLGYVRTLADAVIENMETELAHYQHEDLQNGSDMEKRFLRHMNKSRSFNGKTSMIKEAEHHVSIMPSEFDRHIALINCKNGILDLKTFNFTEHCKEKYITKITQCTYNPDAPEPTRWLAFLNDIFDGNQELIRYIQKAVGYTLTGSTAQQCVFFLYGTGRNGKSTFLEVIRYIMGDYATNIQPQTIMVKQTSGNAPSGDIARLKGARLVTSVEPNEGMVLNEGLIKQLTGDDIVTARKIFSEEFEFKPEFKLFMATNYKPKIKGTDTGIWRRIHLIPFTVRIPEEKVDRHLKYKLAKEYESIFKWAVEGCKLWQDEGLKMPPVMINAVREYKHEMDVISSFIESCCIEGQGEVKASVLYAVYSRWAESSNEYKMSSTKFGAEMAKRFEKVRDKSGITYKGISLSEDNPYSVSIG